MFKKLLWPISAIVVVWFTCAIIIFAVYMSRDIIAQNEVVKHNVVCVVDGFEYDLKSDKLTILLKYDSKIYKSNSKYLLAKYLQGNQQLICDLQANGTLVDPKH